MGMPLGTLRVPACDWDAERPGLHSHAERGNDQWERASVKTAETSNTPPLPRSAPYTPNSPIHRRR
ncbi:hypothetical protein EGJ55_26575 [Pseudomonas moraviensis]|nr:hypothetical protein EGJ55_26575 [Pseudomonas moraviensis]RRW60777.1 hypothetical protein EGJ53_24680 [Pseudomonas fluorescens]